MCVSVVCVCVCVCVSVGGGVLELIPLVPQALERIEELGDFLSILYKKKKRFWLF